MSCCSNPVTSLRSCPSDHYDDAQLVANVWKISWGSLLDFKEEGTSAPNDGHAGGAGLSPSESLIWSCLVSTQIGEGGSGARESVDEKEDRHSSQSQEWAQHPEKTWVCQAWLSDTAVSSQSKNPLILSDKDLVNLNPLLWGQGN